MCTLNRVYLVRAPLQLYPSALCASATTSDVARARALEPASGRGGLGHPPLAKKLVGGRRAVRWHVLTFCGGGDAGTLTEFMRPRAGRARAVAAGSGRRAASAEHDQLLTRDAGVAQHDLHAECVISVILVVAPCGRVEP